MSGDPIARSKEIFAAALAVRGEARRALLDQRCGDDGALRADVEGLLEAAEHTESFLETPALSAEAGADDWSEPPAWMRPGVRVGRYTLVRRLGEGGMGVVFAAEQEAPRRTVALKLMRPGFASAALARRFAREAAVLGRLKHPGIAQVYEAGTETVAGAPVPYLAMELVEGAVLSEWARQGRSARDRAAAIAQVCDAVAHAHQRGVIHRDLKPGNVLVDASGAVKVLDFGIARLVEGDAPGTTVHTAAGVILGTLAYMSPEQVSGDPSRVDVRSDVYGLGALMFDTLAGRPPIDVEGLSVHEAARRIAEREPARLGAAARELRGDLETIAAKALEKDPARRYPSAAEMAEDLRRHLRHEPILARPASAAYTVRKFARRNRALVVGAMAVFLALAGGLGATLVQARRAREAAQTATAINAFLQEMLRSVEPDRAGKDATVREVLDRASATLDDRFADRPLVRAGLRAAIASSYVALGRFGDGESHARAAWETYDALGLARTPGALDARGVLASALQEQGRFRDTIDLLRSAVRDAEAAGLGQTAAAINLRTNLAFACENAGLDDEAGALHAAIIESSRRRLGEGDRATILSSSNYALFLIDRGRLAEAESILAKVSDLAARTYGERSDIALTTLVNLSVCYSRAGRDAEAEPLIRRAVAVAEELLGADHPDTVHHRVNLAVSLTALGRLDEAEREIVPMADLARSRYGLADERTLHALGVAAKLRLAQDRFEEALELSAEQYAGCAELYGPENRMTGNAADLAARILIRAGRPGEAAPWNERARAAGVLPAGVPET